MNLATLRPPPANDTSEVKTAVTALHLREKYTAGSTRLPGYVLGRILSVVRSGASIKGSSVRRVSVDFLVDSLPDTANIEVVSSPMGTHGELCRFRLMQGAHTIARGTVVLDTSWPTPQGSESVSAMEPPRLSEQARRMNRDTDSRFYRFDSSNELSRRTMQPREGGFIRFRDARAINAQTVAELSDGWSLLRDPSRRTDKSYCTAVTLDFCVPLTPRSLDRLRFVRIEQQSDALIQGATIEHGVVSTYDGEPIAEFQRVVTER